MDGTCSACLHSGIGAFRQRRLLWTAVLVLILAFSIVFATDVTITRSADADYAGVFLRAYYENLNSPVTGCTSPCLTVDTQTIQTNPTSGSFPLSAGSSMYLWSPQLSSATAIPAANLGLNLFAALPDPAPDGTASGAWANGTSFTIGPVTTTNAQDVVIVWVVTYESGTSILVSSVTDTNGMVAWQSSARKSFVSCSGAQETTMTEWYGTAVSAIASVDTITVNLSGTPTAASGMEFGISGANTAAPFDPSGGLPNTGLPSCDTSTSAPTASGVSTTDPADFVFAAYGGYPSTTEAAGQIGGAAATMIGTVPCLGCSLAAEYLQVSSALSSDSCTFGTATAYWGALCDAVTPNRAIAVTYETTNSAGAAQSVMIDGATATASYTGDTALSLASSAGFVPASGYVLVQITAPSNVGLTVSWGFGKPTDFQVSYTVRA